MSDETPTQRFDSPLTPTTPPTAAPEEKKKRGLLIALIAVGAFLLVVLIVLLFVLIGSNKTPAAAVSLTPSPSPTTSSNATPSPADSASSAPSAAASSAPKPAATASTAPDDGNVHVTGFTVTPTTIDCSAGKPNLVVKWSSTNGQTAYFGLNTVDAQSGGMGWDLPPTGTDADFPAGNSPYPATCDDTTNYTITIVGNGSKASKTVTVTKKK